MDGSEQFDLTVKIFIKLCVKNNVFEGKDYPYYWKIAEGMVAHIVRVSVGEA